MLADMRKMRSDIQPWIEKAAYEQVHLCTSLEDLTSMIAALKDGDSRDAAHFHLGEVYFKLGDDAAAFMHWGLAADEGPGELSDWARKNQADVLVKAGKGEEAMALYKAIEPEGADFCLHLLESRLALVAGSDAGEALYYMLKILTIDPMHEETLEASWRLAYREEMELLCASLSIQALEHLPSRKWYNRLIHVRAAVLDAESTVVNRAMKAAIYADPNRFLSGLFFPFANEMSKRGALAFFLFDVYQEAGAEAMGSQLHASGDELVRLMLEDLIMTDTEDEIWREVLAFMGDSSPGRFLSYYLNRGEAVYRASDSPLLMTVIETLHQRFQSSLDQMKLMVLDLSLWQRHSMNRSVRNLMICGTFTNGKTSLIHALLKREIASVDLLPTTSALTFISDGREEQRFVVDLEGVATGITEDAFLEQTTIDHDKGDGRHSNGSYAVETPMGSFSSLRFIDTPGFNDRSTEENASFDYLEHTDALLYVLDASHPFTRVEKETIMRMRKLSPCLPIVIVVNKMDYIYDEEEVEEVLDDVTNKARSFIDSDVLVFPFSTVEETFQYELRAWLSGDPFFPDGHKRANTWFTELCKAVDRLVEKRDKVDGYLSKQLIQARKKRKQMSERKRQIEQILPLWQSRFKQEIEVALMSWSSGFKAFSEAFLNKVITKVSVSASLDAVALQVQVDMIGKLVPMIKKEVMPRYLKQMHQAMDQTILRNIEDLPFLSEQEQALYEEELEQKVASVMSDLHKGVANIQFDPEVIVVQSGFWSGANRRFMSEKDAERDKVKAYKTKLIETGPELILRDVFMDLENLHQPEVWYKAVMMSWVEAVLKNATEDVRKAEQQVESLEKSLKQLAKEDTILQEEILPLARLSKRLWQHKGKEKAESR